MASRYGLVDRSQLNWLILYRLGMIACAPLAAELIGSAFNIWYNLTQIQLLLTPAQNRVFVNTLLIYNVVVYPVALFLWVQLVLSLQRPLQQILHQQTLRAEHLIKARQRAINLPWWGMLIAGIGWLLCIPAFLLPLHYAPGTLDRRVFLHLSISVIVAALIAVPQGFFIVELFTQRLLYPLLFQEAHPAETPGAFPLSLRQRGLVWAISAGVCPIASLLLLSLTYRSSATPDPWFTISVGVLGMVFGFSSAWMVGQLVVEPVEMLQQAARAVAAGNLNIHIKLLRADEFGPLIDDFNDMIEELRDKQRLQETFGRHVGQTAAQQILQRDPSLGGVEQELTIVFADIRNFTARSAVSSPQQVVAMLNLFLTEMVKIVEQEHGGMVNKFLGDGFMALFGVGDDPHNHAAKAVAAAQKMLLSLQFINSDLAKQGQAPLAMGIGIHTGSVVLGSIGSPQRLEYTAIGDPVNVASRIESLTKELGTPLLLSAATHKQLPSTISTQELPPQQVKGQPHPIIVYCLKE
ncbi:adenylate/guanylate cyclase domain-containing protein [Coleofasciculus sp. FACHB-129]|uniref:adenylate/guanylate cyclase domain-containing protein n=1 Tax=Cyanophyceae TaxID=3028117 RepID=UPI001F54F90F|nr:adenylate/guanylate cyclase domain-containing protein [Coleofasciculus sp. FACHB-129]